MQEICNRLNVLLPANDDNIQEINDLIQEVYNLGGQLYFSRKLWINNKFDDSSTKDTIYTDKVKFVPSDESEEHQGIKLIYKDETL